MSHTPQPSVTNTYYERHYTLVRLNDTVRPRKSGAATHTDRVPNSNNKKQKLKIQRMSISPTRTMHLTAGDFGESGACAESSNPSDLSMNDDAGETVATTTEVLTLLLQKLNCIGAALTLGAQDSIRVFSYYFVPPRHFADDGTLCETCCKDAFPGACEDCDHASAVLNMVDRVTSRIFDVVVRPSFNVTASGPEDPRIKLIHEIRYRQEILRPALPPKSEFRSRSTNN